MTAYWDGFTGWMRRDPHSLGLPFLVIGLVVFVWGAATRNPGLTVTAAVTFVIAGGVAYWGEWLDRPRTMRTNVHVPAEWVDVVEKQAAHFAHFTDDGKGWDHVSALGCQILGSDMPGAVGLVTHLLETYDEHRNGWAVVSTKMEGLLRLPTMRRNTTNALIYEKAPVKMVTGVWRNGHAYPIDPVPLSVFGLGYAPRPVHYLTVEQARMVRAVLGKEGNHE